MRPDLGSPRRRQSRSFKLHGAAAVAAILGILALNAVMIALMVAVVVWTLRLLGVL